MQEGVVMAIVFDTENGVMAIFFYQFSTMAPI